MTHRITRVAGSSAPQLPITLETAKLHAHITVDAEDEVLRQYLSGAVEWCEEVTHRAITQRSYLIVRDKFPRKFWRLPLGYIDSITSIVYLDTNGAQQTWSTSSYTLDNASDSAATVRPVPSQSWPSIGEYPSSARMTVVAGWSTDNVPWSLRNAILQRFGQLVESRAPGDPEEQAMEQATRILLAPWILPIWA